MQPVKTMMLYTSLLDDVYTQVYTEIEEYLENVRDSPSTINKLLFHYAITYDPLQKDKIFITFCTRTSEGYELATTVKEYNLVKRLNNYVYSE